jgi:sensor histidine kinase regulating citrate/malate metabolism
LRQRYTHERVEFDGGPLPEGTTLPSDLFASVAENLLQNALEKRKMQGNLRILVRLQWSDGFALSVCDDGSPIPDQLAAQLFNSPVPSNSGLGVGLYQVARFAHEQGFEVALSSNQPGRVCFTLTQSSSARR